MIHLLDRPFRKLNNNKIFINYQCSQNGRFAGIWAGAAKRIPEPFSEYSEGNLKFKSREAAFLGPFWLGMSEVQSKNFTHITNKERKAVSGLRHLRSKIKIKQ